METGRECKTWKKKWLQVLSVSDWVLCSTQGYILDSTRLSGRVFVGADITKYGPLEEITCSYQEAWWSFTITDEPIVAAFCAGAFWNINCHTFPFCIRKLPRKLTVVLLFSLATPHPPTLFSPPPHPFFPHPHLCWWSWNTSLQATPLCSSRLSPVRVLSLHHFVPCMTPLLGSFKC